MTYLCATSILGLIMTLLLHQPSLQSFKAQQLKYPRVKAAIAEKESLLREIFEKKKLGYPPRRIFIRVFKREQALELWASGTSQGAFELLKEYKFCANSGSLGPKRHQGDGQIPEGFYYIDRFNPNSNFHLSLGVNYPNQSDRILGVKGRLGGDIFIHGDCVTIGCIPITDDGIKELYLIAIEARSAGQASIPVHIFPTRMHQKGIKRLERDNNGLLNFWLNLKEGYDFFEEHRRLPTITIDTHGRYKFNA